MKPRRPARWRHRSRFLWQVQRARLAAIARGELAPRHRHEHLYLLTLRLRGRANPADFILPGLMLHAELTAAGAAPPE